MWTTTQVMWCDPILTQHGYTLAVQRMGGGHNASGRTNNWLVCSLILRKISKICEIADFKAKNFKAKMHQICFLFGSTPNPAPPDSLAVFKGLTSKGRRGQGRGRKGKGRRGGEEVEEGIWPIQKFWLAPLWCSKQYSPLHCIWATE